jgi:SAM-dependent methyltransferase
VAPDREPLTPPTLDAGFWDGRYRTGETGWDLGEPSPPFVRLHRDGGIAPCRVAVPGCGRGWEVVWLAREGYAVTGIDFAPAALAEVSARARAEGVAPELVRADLLDPPETLWGRFDLVLEQTCFCAIDPARRPEYVEAVHRLLAPGGRLVGLFYECGGEGGPPFTTGPEEVRALFGGRFRVEVLARTPHSHPRRRGQEWLGVLARR